MIAKGLSKNKISNLRDVTRVNLSKIIYVILGQTLRTVERIKYPVGAACRRPFAASQTRGGGAAAPTHDFVWQALDPYSFASA